MAIRDVKAALETAIARALLRAAVRLQVEHVRRLGVSNPRPYTTPSAPGEYPRKRTGAGQRGIFFEPTTPSGVIAAGLKVKVGIRANVFYLEALVRNQDRLGLKQTFLDMLPELQQDIARAARIGGSA